MNDSLDLVDYVKLPNYKLGYDRTYETLLYTGSRGNDFTRYDSTLNVTDRGLICAECDNNLMNTLYVVYTEDENHLYAMSENLITVFDKTENYHYSLEFKEGSSTVFFTTIISVAILYSISVVYKKYNDEISEVT